MIVPGETFDGIEVLPERQYFEMRYISFGAAQTLRVTISRGRLVLGSAIRSLGSRYLSRFSMGTIPCQIRAII